MTPARRALLAALPVLVALAAISGCTPSGGGHGADGRGAGQGAGDHGAGRTAVAGTEGPHGALVDPGPGGVSVAAGDDWTLPGWVRPATNSGFFSEQARADAAVDVRSVDVTWRQLQPSAGSPIDTTARGSAEGMDFDGLAAQRAEHPVGTSGDYWMRIFASAKQWAPTWVRSECGVRTYGPDYDGQRHLPIWNECVWSQLLATYRTLFVDDGVAADPHLRFVYVPGAFTWAEFDYDVIDQAVKTGDLDWAEYHAWYSHAWSDLVQLFGPYSSKLVFTGEDYPFGPFGTKDDLLATRAVDAGLGIRTGITELSNFHLSEAPAYGSHVQPDGHLVVDESLPVHDGTRVVATENECYTTCGYHTDQPYYAVRQSNLKALQLRMNWMYVVPADSFLARYPQQWEWVRLSLGQTASTSADAWADLRDAEDTYWDDPAAPFTSRASWRTRPYVRNLERWLVQVDVPGSVAHRSTTDVHRHVFEKDNGVAYEGLTTARSAGDTGLAFDVDPRFAAVAGSGRTLLKVTFTDSGRGAFRVQTPAGESAAVTRTGDGVEKTATIALPAGALAGAAPRLRLALADGADDLTVRFVRLVRVDP